MSTYIFAEELQYRDLIQAFSQFHDLECLHLENYDPKARELFEQLASHLLDNIQKCFYALQATHNAAVRFKFRPSFTQYADFARELFWFPMESDRYEKTGFRHVGERIDQLSEHAILELLFSFRGGLEQTFRTLIGSPFLCESILKNTRIALDRIKLASKDPDEETRALRDTNHIALQHNLFGSEWVGHIEGSVEAADAHIDEELTTIITETVERDPDTDNPILPIPDPDKYGEKFDYDKELDEFCQLRAAYLLLTGQESTYFDRYDTDDPDDQPAAASSPVAPAAEENQQPTVPAEERKHRIGLYVGLAQTSMKLPDDVLKAISKVFDPGDDALWGKIAEDKQNRIDYTDNDHTNLTPFFNLLGVLKRKGQLPTGKDWTALLDKLPNNFHSKNKKAIKTAVDNGSRTDTRPLARTIEHRLDQQ